MNTEIFNKLYDTDCSKHIEKKKTGKTELSYLSWAWAWAIFRKNCPDATYRVIKFDGVPYICDPSTGIMVFTEITAGGETHEMWLPVMDASNKAMKLEPYSYKVWNYDKRDYETKYVAAATMFDINKTIMRCLTKNIAMFGLGLSIFAGEDIPIPLTAEDEAAIGEEIKSKGNGKVTIEDSDLDKIGEIAEWIARQPDFEAAKNRAKMRYNWTGSAYQFCIEKANEIKQK